MKIKVSNLKRAKTAVLKIWEYNTRHILVRIIILRLKWGDNGGNLPIVYIDILIFFLLIMSRRSFYLILKGTLSGLRQFLATESPLKMMKNAFYFTSKALFVLKISKFCLDFLVMYQNALIKKIRLISNFMMSQPG